MGYLHVWLCTLDTQSGISGGVFLTPLSLEVGIEVRKTWRFGNKTG